MPISVAYVFDDSDDVYWCWEELYNHVLDDHAPVITTKKRPSTGSKFITTDIRKAMRERDRLKKKFHKFRNPLNWENYEEQTDEEQICKHQKTGNTGIF